MSGQTNEDAAAAAAPAPAAGRESPARHIELVEDEAAHHENGAPSPALTDSKGWDGKLRVDRTAQLQNPEAISDPEYSDDENVLPGESVPADEGWFLHHPLNSSSSKRNPALLIMNPFPKVIGSSQLTVRFSSLPTHRHSGR